MTPEEVAQQINNLATPSDNFYNSEQVSQYEVSSELIKGADLTFKKDKVLSEFWRSITKNTPFVIATCLFLIEKYYKELAKNWDLFYKRNETNFFKDRMWLHREFTEVTDEGINGEFDIEMKANIQNLSDESNEKRPLLIEIGCGVGNALFPILYRNSNLTAIGFDCSKRAVDFVKVRWTQTQSCKVAPLQPRKRTSKNTIIALSENLSQAENEEFRVIVDDGFSNDHYHEAGEDDYTWRGGQLLDVHVWDITEGEVPTSICLPASADFVLMLFVLSAIPPHFFKEVASRAAKLLKPGGILMFRDYARYDLAQIRFAESQRSLLEENFYVRQDGTLAYFFTSDELTTLFVENCGLEQLEMRYFLREFKNRKMQKRMKRVWLQAKFKKKN